MGDKITIADLIYFPFVYRFMLIAEHIIGNKIPDRVEQWLHQVQGIEEVRATLHPGLLDAFKSERSLDFFDYRNIRRDDL